MTVLVFALGPVQGFIAQSRRTADGWVGSFLLSYLSCHAAIALEAHGTVIEPSLDDIALYNALKRKTLGRKDDLTTAALPNNMVVELREGADPKTAGEEAQQAVSKAWKDIGNKVIKGLPDSVKEAPTLRDIWSRQNSQVWEMYWACGSTTTEAFHALAARKGLRDFSVLQERGDRCTLCAEREALWDGAMRQGDKTPRDASVCFWRELAERQKPVGLIKSGGKERLCAPCLIKRLIPWVDNPIRRLWGSKDVVFPSTSTMATVLTKCELVQQAYVERNNALKQAIQRYLDQLTRNVPDYARPADPADAFQAWKETLDVVNASDKDEAEAFIRLDGDWLLYGEGVKNELGLDLATHRQVDAAYRALWKEARRAGVKPPPIYWALLTMDGDRMGKLKETFPTEGLKISRLLNKFASEVPAIVRQYNGRTVYAGGDDVLAFFPMETALDAAEELRQKFAQRFTDWLNEDSYRQRKLNEAGLEPPTLSASLIYAHHQVPLGALIHRGHTLLTDKAKKEAGRNALAVEVRTRGGPTLTFAHRWEDQAGVCLKARIQEVVRLLREKGVASRFLYRMREEAGLLGPRGPLAKVELEQRKAYVASLAEKTRLAEPTEAQQVAEKVLALCEHSGRDRFTTDPLILARFLATGGREER